MCRRPSLRFCILLFTIILSINFFSCGGEKKNKSTSTAENIHKTSDEKIDINKSLYDFGMIPSNPNTPAIDFTLEDLDGKKVSLKSLKGKVIFLNFWATHCGPCKIEMPFMEKLYQKMKGKDFIILALSLDRKESLEKEKIRVKEFVTNYKLTFPILFDYTGTVSNLYRVYEIPVTYIINKKGNTLGKIIGAHDWASDVSVKLFTALSEE